MPELFRLVFASGEMEVRGALGRLRRWMAARDLDETVQGTVELVLGEVLNNVVEHAYGEDRQGEIELCCETRCDMLRFEVGDCGREMPGLSLPEGRPARLNCAREDLPEGGFGWFLVHRLTRDLTYSRSAGCNRLRFDIAQSP